MYNKKVISRVGVVAVLFTLVVIVASFFASTTIREKDVSPREDSENFLIEDEVPSNESETVEFESISNHTLLLVVVVCRPTAKENRNAIRETWFKVYQDKPQDALLRFSIGTSGLQANVLADIAKEQETYGDLMLLEDVRDSYANLTLKVLKSLLSAYKRYNFSYILKADDDSYIILERIVGELQHRESNKSFYWGYMYIRGKVNKRGRYAEKNWFLSNKYLPYAQGSGYILSSDLVKYISVMPEKLMFYNNEDVSLGTWISPYDVERKNDMRLSHNYKCTGEAIVFNPVSNERMHKMFTNFTKKGTVC